MEVSPLVRRTLITFAVLFCLAGVVFAFSWADTDQDAGFAISDANPIEERIPAPDSEILRQDVVGVDLRPGWTGVLIVNEVEIPEDQLDLANLDSLGQILYRATEDSAVQFEAGRNCATAVVWRVEESRADSRTDTWCFNVT